MRRIPFRLLAAVAVWAAMPLQAAAQFDASSLHATIRGWADQNWLYLLDRGAVDGGRLNDLGVLQRFHPDIDAEHALDQISSRFGLSDEFVWQEGGAGVRYWAGSINHRALVAGLDAKARVPLGSGWAMAFRFDKEDGPAIERNLPRLRLERDWRSGPFGYLEGTLLPLKPEMDLALGAGWRHGQTGIEMSFTLLEAFSDIIYQGLVVWPGFADTALDYERLPLALRTSVRHSIGRHLRFEADFGLLLQSKFRAYRQLAPDSGFHQDEDFAQAAGLIEWTTLPRLRLGAFAGWVRAVTDRSPLPLGRPVDDFQMVEQTTEVGAFVLARIARKWRTEAWVSRSFRPQTKDFRAADTTDVDYEDRAWSGQVLLAFGSASGIEAGAAFEMDLRDVIRGDGQVPVLESLGRHNTRLRLELGWRFGDRVALAAGYRMDLDGDDYTDHGSFDGAHGRVVMYW